MQLDAATLDAHRDYLNHVLSCSACYAPTNRYCLVGKRLQVMYQGHYTMSHPIEVRRLMLARIEARNPNYCDELKACMLEIHETARKAMIYDVYTEEHGVSILLQEE